MIAFFYSFLGKKGLPLSCILFHFINPLATYGLHFHSISITWTFISFYSYHNSKLNENIFNINVYPNPFNQPATLFIQSSKSDKAQVQIFDMVGNLVWNEQVNTNTNVTIGNDFATGTYIVKVLNQNGEQAIQRMIKTN